MLFVALSWIYMLVLAYIYGAFILNIVTRKKQNIVYQIRYLDSYLWAGTVFFTVYGLLYSFIGGLGLTANVILSCGALLILLLDRKNLWCRLRMGLESIGIAKKMTLLICFLVVAYFSSRGYEHFDTLLYHGQTIHWLEEYGTVIGLGNAYERYAYNSTAFVLTALFSFSYLAGQSLHTCAGFLVLLLVATVVIGWEPVWKRRIRTSDLIRIMSLYYITMVLNQIVSPASDYFAMVTVFYIVLQFVDCLEKKEESPYPYGLLCVVVCFAVSLKTSAAPVVLLVIVPAVLLIRAKDWSSIAKFLALGCLVMIPFFARGVAVSGYLMYPSAMFDVFQVDWKMDPQILEADQAGVQAWGKGIEFEERWDLSLKEWFPIWLSRQKSTMEKLLVLVDFPVMLLLTLYCVWQLVRKKIQWKWWVVDITLIISFLFWFLMAPLIRYGWCYILLLPALFGGLVFSMVPWERGARWQWLHRTILILILTVGVYKGVKVWEIGMSYSGLPYYVKQQDYTFVGGSEINLDGITLYEHTEQFWGYHTFPMIESAKEVWLRGENLREGFRARTE